MQHLKLPLLLHFFQFGSPAAGFVYNVTAYFEFHPGGEEELSRGIGIDATALFDQVSLVGKLLFL
jgi:hypothetical protein